MNDEDLRYIIAVEEEGNISRAAERCFVSQPALSQTIRKLEEELGVSLFAKQGGRLVPTEEGCIVLRHAREMAAIREATLKALQGPC